MITKFSNLEDLFSFLELKRAEIIEEFGINNAANNIGDIVSSQISETFLEMTTDELKEVEIVSEKQVKKHEENNTSLLIQEDSIDEIINGSMILKEDKSAITSKKYYYEDAFSQESSIESEIIQMEWSTSLETPKKVTTDTTIIMEQLNLNFDDCIDADLFDFEEPPQGSLVVDPLGLDSLTFPISQFLNEEINQEEDYEDEDKNDFLDEIISVFEEETKSIEFTESVGKLDDFDFDITMSQFPSTQPLIQPNEFPVSFTTGRGIKLSPPSETALKKATSTLEESGFVGFKTGRGKELPAPSKEAIKRARSLIELEELDNEKENYGSDLPMPIFTTGRGKAMPQPSEEAMKRAKSLIDAETSVITMPLACAGFSTGRGKALPPPSEEALARASKLFDNYDETINIPSAGFSTARGKALPPPSEEALARASKLIDDTPPASSIISVGFSTGNGKTLPPPSDTAMKKAAKFIGTSATNKKPLIVGNTAFKAPSLIKTESKPPPKPFPMSTAWKRPRNVPVPVVKVEPVKLFDLSTEGMQRFKLRDFFKTTPNLNISDYSSYGIPETILKISSKSAKYFKFPDDWGVEEAHQNLIKNGAQAVSISLEWTANHYRWIVWKFASILRCFPEKYSIANLSPSWVLQQLLYRYEREIHQCNRSALKKIIERDDAAGKYLCLIVASIDEDSMSLELSDGWYSIWTNKLEAPLWDLVLNKKIFEGMKIEVSGASLTGQDGVPALEASSKDCQCRLIIWRNSCRIASWDTKLGFICTSNRAVSFLKHLNQIHPQGGPIPAISLIIDRVYPLLFREDVNDNHVARNEKDHYLYLELNPEQASNSKFTPIQRIKVFGNCEIESTALITFWNPIGEDQRALLQEGSVVIITNLKANSKTSKLSLVSTKSTRIFKDENGKKTLKNTWIVKIDLENYFLLSNLKLNEFFDVQGVSLGRVGSFYWIGGVNNGDDSSTFLICLKNFNCNNFNRGEIINFRDLTFNHFDAREGVAHFTFSEYSDFKKDSNKIASQQLQPLIKRFKELTEVEGN